MKNTRRTNNIKDVNDLIKQGWSLATIHKDGTLKIFNLRKEKETTP